MKIENAPLEGLKILTYQEFGDSRGKFMERFHHEKFEKLGLPSQFSQMNHSVSVKNVLRGLHYQMSPPQGKLVSCTQGEILDVAVDIRKDSPTYKQSFSMKLSEREAKALWIPEGFAHGFVVLSEKEAHVMYFVRGVYNPSTEVTIVFDDPDLNIDWQVANPILSDKDRKGLSFAEFEKKLETTLAPHTIAHTSERNLPGNLQT